MSHSYVIIDCCPSPYVDDKQFVKWLDSVVTYCNSHLMVDEKNELTVILSYIGINKVLLCTVGGIKPLRSIIPRHGQFEKFAFTTEIIRNGIVEFAKDCQNFQPGDCALASALGLSLCRINNDKNKLSKILVVSCSIQSSSFSSQYMNLMNSFFAAQKTGVPIDGCIYMKDESRRGSILEQGCDLTGGQFLNTPDISGFLEYLLLIFLPDSKMRSKLLLPEQKKANHRAVCFCHRKIIDIGYVCSVCLSIFCTFSPICSSCQTHFKLDIPNKVTKKGLSNSQSTP